MTQTEAMDAFDRLKRAGYRLGAEVPERDVFDEWYRALGGYPAEAVDAGISRLVRGKADTFWPSIGELREHIHAVTAGRERDERCSTCHGSTWTDAPPYRANGGLVYQGVRRCPDCGVPAPSLGHLRGLQMPLSASELRDWGRARSETSIAAPASPGEFLAMVRAMAARMRMRPVAQEGAHGE